MNIVDRVTSKGIPYEISDSRAREEKLDKSELPDRLSAFKNDLGLIDSTITNLENFYNKNETYSKTEIDQKLALKLRVYIVDELPTEGIDRSAIYFVPRTPTEASAGDVYDEYIWVGDWELIGNTHVDLSNYYTKAEADLKTAGKVEEETVARVSADAAINAEISALKTEDESLDGKITTEKNRAEYAELQLQNAIGKSDSSIAAETMRAQTAENRLSDRMDSVEPHLLDTENPHSVTAKQVGLGNVANVGTDESPTMNSRNNVESGGVFSALEDKVDKVSGKGLSDQNFTYEEKTKLHNLSNYDDTALSGRVTENEAAIATLNGTGEGSVKKTVADEIARVVDDAPEDFDTLKEISDWISAHPEDTAAMNAQIQANKGAIETLNGSDTTAGSVAKSVKDASDGLQSQIDTNTSDIADNATAIATETTNRTNADNNLLLQLNTLKGVAMTMYASESLLPSAIDFENGVVVAVGEIAWCVEEKTWHKVSAVDADTLAITWKDYDPHIQADIDLSDYAKKAEVTAAVGVKNDKIAVSDAGSAALTDTDTVLSADAGENPTAMKSSPLSKLWTYIKNKFETYFSIFFHDDDLRIFNEDGDIEIGEPNDKNAYMTHILNDCSMEHELTVKGDMGVGGDIGIDGDMSVLGEIDQIGTLADLTTKAKNNIVSAINEINNSKSGELVIGASTIRKGTTPLNAISSGMKNKDLTVTFAEPMLDADYEVILNGTDSCYVNLFSYKILEKTKNGFTIRCLQNNNTKSIGNTYIQFEYTAFKLFTGDAGAVKTATIEKTTVAGLTTGWADGVEAAHKAFRIGKQVVMNVALSITGTFTGTTGWQPMFNLPTSLLESGENFAAPYMISVNDPPDSTLLDGNLVFFENGQVVNFGIKAQIILPILG